VFTLDILHFKEIIIGTCTFIGDQKIGIISHIKIIKYNIFVLRRLMMSIEKELGSLKRYTVEEFQADFDNLMNLVEKEMKSFIITSEYGEAVLMPADEELIRIYTDHNEAP
jgi:hypothetical protein